MVTRTGRRGEENPGGGSWTPAAYLAGAGQSVLLVERNDWIGGATTSQRAFPDYDARLSRYAYLISLLSPTIVEELGLAFETRRRETASFTAYERDGKARGLLISNVDEGVTRNSLAELTGDDEPERLLVELRTAAGVADVEHCVVEPSYGCSHEARNPLSRSMIPGNTATNHSMVPPGRHPAPSSWMVNGSSRVTRVGDTVKAKSSGVGTSKPWLAVEDPHSAAADRRPLPVDNEKRASPLGDFRGIQVEVIGSRLGVGAPQLGVQRLDERPADLRGQLGTGNGDRIGGHGHAGPAPCGFIVRRRSPRNSLPRPQETLGEI